MGAHVARPDTFRPATSTESDQTGIFGRRPWYRYQAQSLERIQCAAVSESVIWLPATDTAVRAIVNGLNRGGTRRPSRSGSMPTSPETVSYPFWLDALACSLLAIVPIGFVVLLLGYSATGAATMAVGFAALWVFRFVGVRRRHMWRR